VPCARPDKPDFPASYSCAICARIRATSLLFSMFPSQIGRVILRIIPNADSTAEQYNTEGLAKLLLFLTVVVLKRHRWRGNRRDASNDPASRRCTRRHASDSF